MTGVGNRPPRIHRIEVRDSESVVPRGTRRIEWSVHVNDGWVKARDAHGASVKSVDAPSGTVWERLIALELPTGARLLRVEVRPGAPVRRDALEYLTGNPKSKGALSKHVFRVTADGRLARVEQK